MDFTKQYLKFEEYKKLGGLLDQVPFNILEFEARQNVDKYTFGRLKNLTTQIDEVKMCVFKLVNTLESYSKQEIQNKGIASESTDGYSVSYIQASPNIVSAKNSDISSIVKEYLSDCKLEDGTPYLYCGADYDN